MDYEIRLKEALDMCEKSPLDSQVIVLSTVCKILAKQVKYPNHNQVEHMAKQLLTVTSLEAVAVCAKYVEFLEE